MSDELVERVAEALCREDIRFGAEPWVDVPDKSAIGTSRDWYRSLARAALAIIEPAVRDDERGRCAALVKGWVPWRSDINPPLAAAIRAGAKP